MEKFFSADIVALKADASIKAVIWATWRDNATIERGVYPDDWIDHKEYTRQAIDETIQNGKPPVGWVIIEFPPPSCGRTLVAESAIQLLDRAMFVGDVVKRDVSAMESGIVTNTRSQCLIQPIYTDLPYQGSESWPHQAQDNELWVPSHELHLDDFQPGDYVSYKGWIGDVMGVEQEVTVCLRNGSVVRVNDPARLHISHYWTETLRTPNAEKMRTENTLLDSLEFVQGKVKDISVAPALQAPIEFCVGSKVQTKKNNLRLGHWVIGRYHASIPPEGVIVETRVVSIDVEWIVTNMYDRRLLSQQKPDNILTTDHFDEVRIYDTRLPASQFGSRLAREPEVGEVCRFKDEPEAALKYNMESEPGQRFRRIPRTLTLGFNMNIFNVVQTITMAEVEWQNGTKEWRSASSLIPHGTIDDHDIWPGEIVSMRSQQTEENGLIRANKLGVVQSVDAQDRVAEVRWYENPDVQCFASDQMTREPDSRCGKLSEESSSVSLYDISAYDALNRRRGDIVFVRSLAKSDVAQPTGGAATGDAHTTVEPKDSRDLPWAGLVVDTSKDGYVTVRLGACKPVRDIRVSVDDVELVINPDDEDPLDSQDSMMDDSMMDDDSEEDIESLETIEETITYEGGEPWNDDAEDAWMTDASDDDIISDSNVQPGLISPVSEAAEAEAEPKRDEDNVPSDAKPSPLTEISQEILPEQEHENSKEQKTDSATDQVEYQFNEFDSMPPQFLVLDEAPASDHTWISRPNLETTPGLLRRIRKEHKLLQSSLPRGIWVRTWADRLDLLRILIIGPQGTPYALAPFVFDLAFDMAYPRTPPKVYFHSWTNNVGRVNPNLYEDGVVCLSILGTWPESHHNEAWNPERSSVLQVLVSILGLVLVERPYYNEAGFEEMIGNEEALVNERIYSEKALAMSKGFVAHAITNDITGLADVIRWVYRDAEGPKLLQWVINEARKLRNRDGDQAGERISRGALMLLERYLSTLEAQQNLLQSP